MMKRFFALLIFVLTLNASQAQSDSVYVEVGMNAMRLVTLGWNNNTQPNPDIWNPYLFSLEVGVKKVGVRMGASRFSHSHSELPVPVNGNLRFDNDSARTDFRIGLFYNYSPDDKWSFKFGVDYYMAQTELSSKTDFKEHTTNNHIVQEFNATLKESGFAPFINAQYHITPRVSVGTELLWRIGTFTENQLATDTASPVDVERKYEGKKNYMIPPTALFLTMRF
ncbi:MAG TPA: hypothetical protein VIK71_04325 [Flavobacteriales bacterium]